MSEKRFKVDYEVGVLDTKTNEIVCDTVNAKGVVDLLNELSDENNILNKNEDDLKECTIENIKLREENEQLRQKLIRLQISLNYWQKLYRELYEKTSKG